MGKNANLQAAKRAKNDEFWTQYSDIETEMNAYYEYDNNVFRGKTILLPCDDPEWSNFTKYFVANFERFGLKKLISTSYAKSPRNSIITDFEKRNPEFDPIKNKENGKVFFLDESNYKKGEMNFENLNFYYLRGDGDFRSEEVTKLRNEADIIITNPPFSLFREFVFWIIEAEKQFIIIGSKSAITYKEIFPLIKNNKLWLGNGFSGGNAFFEIPEEMAKNYANGVYNPKTKMVKFRNCGWFTNIDHGLRHEPLQLMTMADNLKYNKKLIKKLPKDKDGNPYYPKYDNYDDVIECPCVDGIPSDYEGVIGVPITFLDKFVSSQFRILGITQRNDDPYKTKKYEVSEYKNANDLNARGVIMVGGIPKPMYVRILIQKLKYKE